MISDDKKKAPIASYRYLRILKCQRKKSVISDIKTLSSLVLDRTGIEIISTDQLHYSVKAA